MGYERTSLGPDWYPDALMPSRRADLNTGFPFSIPDLYNNLRGQRNDAIWFDVFVPFDRRQGPAGRYTGEPRITWKGGQDVLAIVLDGWDFVLPQETTYRATFGTTPSG